MAAGKPPTFRRLPLVARSYLVALFLLTGAASLASMMEAPWTELDLELLALTAALCAVANLFEVFAPGHYSFQPNLVFFFWGALLLPPWALAPLALLCFAPGWLVHRFRWYMTAFNVVNYLLAGLAAHWIVGSVGSLDAPSGFGAEQLAAVAGSAAAFVGLNHLLLLLVVTFAQGRPLTHGLRDRVEGLPLDAALALTGGCLAVLWAAAPGLALLVSGPMFLIYRALWLPLFEHKARTDPKTGLYNSDHLMKELADALSTAKKRRSDLSIVMLDLDHLRLINNRCGHLAGDRVVQAVGELLAQEVGDRGVAARFGSEEFCLLMPGMSVVAARQLGETLRARVEAMRVPSDDADVELAVTISLGIAGYPAHGDTPDSLLQAADAAVYEAKLGGRNRVRVPLPSDTYEIFDAGGPRPTRKSPDPGRDPAPHPALTPAATSVNGGAEIELESEPEPEPEPEARPATSTNRGRRPWARVALIPWYAGLLCVGAALIAIFASHDTALHEPGLFALLIASALALDIFRLDIFERAKVSPASVASIALAMLFGPIGPLVSEGLIAALRALKKERLVKWAWDFGALTIAGAAAAGTYAALPITGPAGLLLGGTAAGLAYYAVNMSLLSLVMGMSDGRGPLIQWREGLAWLGPHYAAFGAMAGTLLLCELELGWYVFAVFGVPVAVLWVAQKQYLDRSRMSVAELRSNAEELEGLLEDREELLARMHRSYLSTITSLARTIEAKDPYTGGHTERVATVARALAARLNFDENGLRAVEVGAIIHDIGKIGIPDEILLKHGSLAEDELREMRRHTDIASYILADLELPPIVKQMARSHHERYDGGGYPDGLSGEEIPLAARILSVADALDAMTSDRPYRSAMPLAEARAEIEAKAGTQFCPRVVATLSKFLDEDAAFRALFEVPVAA